jgi:hypothetical protein
MKGNSLAGFALCFIAGYGLGFTHHHIATFVTNDNAPSDARLRSVEARLAQLEALQMHHHGAFVPRSESLPLPQQGDGASDATRRLNTASVDSHTVAAISNVHDSGKYHAAAAAAAAVEVPAGAVAETTPKRNDDIPGCPPGRKPYHVILTAQDSTYQAWQTRIMVHHLRRIQRSNPCSEITGFTRLLSSPNGGPDGLMDEIPTVLAKELAPGQGCRGTAENSCDMGFPVMNRPHAVTQLLANLPAHITEEYVLIAETDHVFLSEPPNRATPSMPACFPFGYMNAKAADLRPTVARFAKDAATVDPCGPSPVLIHLPQLRKLTPEWLRLSFELKRDAEAEKLFGWVLEMWGYTLAANRLGIQHLVWQNLQTEPSALWHANLEGDPHIYHYTFGLEFTGDGIPVTTIGDWSLDKRHYMGAYPPRQLEPPPRCAGKAAATLTALFNEATGNISSWPTGPAGSPTNGGTKGTRGWGESSGPGVMQTLGGGRGRGVGIVTEAAFRRSRLAQAVTSRGPWKWAGEGPVLFFRGGRMHTPWGAGRWSLSGDAIAVSLGACGMYRLSFNAARTAFAAATGRGVPPSSQGVLDVPAAGGAAGGAKARVRHDDDKDDDDEDDDDDDEGTEGDDPAVVAARWRNDLSDSLIYRRLIGSGPWSWQGVSALGFLGGGVLHTPWGKGTWEPHPTRGANTIYANFVGEKHVVTFDECWSFSSMRERDGDKASGVAKIDATAKSCPALSPKPA